MAPYRMLPARCCLALLLTGSCAILTARGVRADPLAVDASAFPRIRIYYPSAEPPPGGVAEDGSTVVVEPLAETLPRAPLIAALVVDTSGSMKEALPAVQAAASALVGKAGAADRIGLVRFATQVEVASPATADRETLRQRIGALRADGATALYDAVWTGVRLVVDPPGAGLRVALVITDGKDEGEGPPGTPGSALRLEPLRQALATAGVPLFILGLGPAAERDLLASLAADSGGRAAFAARPEEVGAILDSLLMPLFAARSVSYLSPRPAPDGTRRRVEAAASSGATWRGAYRAPRQEALLWRWPVAAPEAPSGGRRRAACGVGALSPAGTWALAFAPLTLLRGDGAVAATAAQGPAIRAERARVLDDGSGWLFGGTQSARFSLESQAVQPDPRPLADLVAVSPGGTHLLRLARPAAGEPTRLEVVKAGSDVPLWFVTCPGPNCDRLAGAAVSDDGAVLFNQTGTLHRIDASGNMLPARPEIFFGPVSLAADGRLAAAVVWQERRGSAPRALLLDPSLRDVLALPVQAADADVPPLAALAPGGRYFAVLDDTRLRGLALDAPAGERPAWRVLAHPGPTPTPCERTLQLDDRGRVLVSDGESLTLLRGLSEP